MASAPRRTSTRRVKKRSAFSPESNVRCFSDGHNTRAPSTDKDDIDFVELFGPGVQMMTKIVISPADEYVEFEGGYISVKERNEKMLSRRKKSDDKGGSTRKPPRVPTPKSPIVAKKATPFTNKLGKRSLATHGSDGKRKMKTSKKIKASQGAARDTGKVPIDPGTISLFDVNPSLQSEQKENTLIQDEKLKSPSGPTGSRRRKSRKPSKLSVEPESPVAKTGNSKAAGIIPANGNKRAPRQRRAAPVAARKLPVCGTATGAEYGTGNGAGFGDTDENGDPLYIEEIVDPMERWEDSKLSAFANGFSARLALDGMPLQNGHISQLSSVPSMPSSTEYFRSVVGSKEEIEVDVVLEDHITRQNTLPFLQQDPMISGGHHDLDAEFEREFAENIQLHPVGLPQNLDELSGEVPSECNFVQGIKRQSTTKQEDLAEATSELQKVNKVLAAALSDWAKKCGQEDLGIEITWAIIESYRARPHPMPMV